MHDREQRRGKFPTSTSVTQCIQTINPVNGYISLGMYIQNIFHLLSTWKLFFNLFYELFLTRVSPFGGSEETRSDNEMSKAYFLDDDVLILNGEP